MLKSIIPKPPSFFRTIEEFSSFGVKWFPSDFLLESLPYLYHSLVSTSSSLLLSPSFTLLLLCFMKIKRTPYTRGRKGSTLAKRRKKERSAVDSLSRFLKNTFSKSLFCFCVVVVTYSFNGLEKLRLNRRISLQKEKANTHAIFFFSNSVLCFQTKWRESWLDKKEGQRIRSGVSKSPSAFKFLSVESLLLSISRKREGRDDYGLCLLQMNWLTVISSSSLPEGLFQTAGMSSFHNTQKEFGSQEIERDCPISTMKKVWGKKRAKKKGRIF